MVNQPDTCLQFQKSESQITSVGKDVEKSEPYTEFTGM